MKTGLMILAAAGLAASASAQMAPSRGIDRIIQTNLTALTDQTVGAAGNDAVARVYDNWTAPPTVLNANYNTGNREIADDLNMLPNGVQWLQSLGFAVSNTAATGSGRNLTGGVMVIRFYNQATGAPILSVGGFNGFTANLPTLNLAPGGSSRISFPAGSLATLGFYFPTNAIYASLQFQSVTGTGGFVMADAGMQIRNGGTIGTSTDALFDVAAAVPAFNFGGTPAANSSWFIDTESIPTPGTAAILGLGGLLAARRRRA